MKQGIALMLSSTLVGATMSALVKALAAYPAAELVFLRCIFALLFVFIWTRWRGLTLSFATQHRLAHIVRSVFNTLSLGLYYWALAYLPLAEVIALAFSQPLFVAALSAPILAEPVGLRRWLAIVAGFAATLLMLRPDMNTGHLLAVGAVILSSVLWAISLLLTRRLSLTENNSTIVLYFLVTGAVLTGTTFPLGWPMPTWIEWGLIIVLGFLSASTQFLVTEAYRRAPAAVISPYYYATLLWATAVGYLFWGETPDLGVAVGAIMLVISGVYLAVHENRAAGKAVS